MVRVDELFDGVLDFPGSEWDIFLGEELLIAIIVDFIIFCGADDGGFIDFEGALVGGFLRVRGLTYCLSLCW